MLLLCTSVHRTCARCALLVAMILHNATAIRVAVYENGGGRHGKAPPEHKEIASDADVAALAEGGKFALYDAHGDIVKGFGHLEKNAAGAANDAQPPSVYLVPTKDFSQFIWPTGGAAGHRVERVGGLDRDVSLETLSLSPRLFYVQNFISPEEAADLIASAVSPDNPYGLRPSTTGHQSWTDGEFDEAAATSSSRTSENAFVVAGDVAMRVKRRAFQMLRVPFDDDLDDSIQVLRYKQRQAYIAHSDWFTLQTDDAHNWDPAAGGTNRMATVFLYLSNVTEGGQTVFVNAESPLATAEGVAAATASMERVLQPPSAVPAVAADLFKPHSWEASMVKDCYGKLAVRPRQGDAVLFYSQGPGGTLEDDSEHGGCPVLQGEKWAANMWVWNGPRYQTARAPPGRSAQKAAPGRDGKVSLKMANNSPAALDFYFDIGGGPVMFATVQPGKSTGAETYKGHTWVAKRGKSELGRFVVDGTEDKQVFAVGDKDEL